MTTLTLHTVPPRPAAVSRTAGRAAARPLRVVPDAPVARVAPAPRLRLTARGRLVVRVSAVLLGLLLAVAAVLAGGRVANAGAQAKPLTVEYHVVRPGETLWQIAGEAAPGADRRDTVARIVELNALGSSDLQAGQRIAVPARP